MDKFQRTRGVLKLMAKVIHRLWKDDNKDFLILPGSLPLYDADIRNEAIYYLPQGWDPVLVAARTYPSLCAQSSAVVCSDSVILSLAHTWSPLLATSLN